jgi:16S rRNA A1518/A1519 N6-dimethyltransferase RsmA/KsgA/DIM1 with predicted DNA glycosylase/AP lyase activity
MRFLRLTAPALLFLVLFAMFGLAQKDQAQPDKTPPDKGEKLAPYFPTPETIVDKMLKLGELKAGETVFDLGSGDGRIVIDAARKYKAHAIGVEIDDSLYKQSMDRIKNLGLSSTARIIHGDLLKQDYSSADLITVYLLPVATGLVTPILEKQLKKGARIVAHDFQFAAWKAERTVDIDDDGEGRAHELYLYRR